MTTSALMRIVTDETVLARQPAEATAEGEPGNPGSGDRPPNRGQSKGLRLVVELRPEDAGFGPRGTRGGSTRIPFISERSSINPRHKQHYPPRCVRHHGRPGARSCSRAKSRRR